jgi:hypothetical protein
MTHGSFVSNVAAHERKHGVFRSADCYVTVEGRAALDHQAIHLASGKQNQRNCK